MNFNWSLRPHISHERLVNVDDEDDEIFFSLLLIVKCNHVERGSYDNLLITQVWIRFLGCAVNSEVNRKFNREGDMLSFNWENQCGGGEQWQMLKQQNNKSTCVWKLWKLELWKYFPTVTTLYIIWLRCSFTPFHFPLNPMSCSEA